MAALGHHRTLLTPILQNICERMLLLLVTDKDLIKCTSSVLNTLCIYQAIYWFGFLFCSVALFYFCLFLSFIISVNYASFIYLIKTHLPYLFKDALSGLKQLLAIESPLKKMKNAFCFTSKVLFVLKIFKFLCWLFGHVWKQLA